jgi:hypothetical protein
VLGVDLAYTGTSYEPSQRMHRPYDVPRRTPVRGGAYRDPGPD